MMDDECRGVRQRRKQADPTCCPVCGITVRAHEMEQHYSMEMDRLNKLSVQKYRKSQTKEMPLATMAYSPSPSPSLSAASSTANASSDPKECWTTYQRIKNNRSARLKLKNRKRRADDPMCPVCNERIPDDIKLHVELCLRRNERNNGRSSASNHDDDDDDDDDISIDVEGDLTSQVLKAFNLQMFLLKPCLVASFIELSALKLPGGGITAGLVTTDRQVRVLLRDLNGKACWDASILYRGPKIQITNIDNIDEKPNLQI
ncbi:uncharacterized protein LOC129580458 [Sitodiplosis mosellana]|uniref:uncharacterized protein LOC129580458 n=1 Tax=Sitodiplosis mosellana TaxID=263140 RepID=UPI0024448769|nr:uncharacterized protein LOC129580458 [Sitodiplosis mosellana]